MNSGRLIGWACLSTRGGGGVGWAEKGRKGGGPRLGQKSKMAKVQEIKSF
jgi:hypothetical protein